MSENVSLPHHQKRSRWFGFAWCVACTLAFVVFSILLLTIIFFVLQIPLGGETVSLRTLVIASGQHVLVPALSFFGDLIKLLFPLPFILLVVLFVLVRWPDHVRNLKIDIPGFFKYEGPANAPEAFKQEVNQAEKAMEKAKKEVDEAYIIGSPYASQLRERYAIQQLVSELALDIANLIGANCPGDYRLTLYIPDLIFEDRLYQFSEYYGRDGQQKTTGKVGRTFSIRYGIIGRVWRTGITEIEGELISREDRKQLPENASIADVVRFIARRWGLTLEEAAAMRKYDSYGAVRIESGGRSVGLVYFDSATKNAFAERDALDGLEKRVERAVEGSKLAGKMLELNREVEPKSRIRVFSSS